MKKNLYGFDQELNKLLGEENTNDYEILKVRGKIIKSIYREIERSENKVIVLELKDRLKEELITYKQQVNNLLKKNKKATKMSLIRELSLKNKRISITGHQISNSFKEVNLIGNLANLTGETISLAFTFLKAPIVLSMKLFEFASPYIVYVLTIPAHLISYLNNKLIKKESPYNGQRISDVSKELGEKLEGIVSKQQDKIKRL
jgi:hypothetical protein